MTRESSGNGIQVCCRGQLSRLQIVVDRLGAENMRRMRCSCFGHLFDIPEFRNQGQLFNALLRRLQCNSQRRMSLGFDIGEEVLEFGPEQFCAITGLKFKGSPHLPQSSTFHKNIFKEKGYITFMEVELQFGEACRADGGESELCLKLAMLYVIYAVYFIKEKTTKAIDVAYMHLIDDLESFISYPWGAAAYEFLVIETHRAKKKLLEKAGDGGRLSVDAHGFISALQCWCYEVMPNLGSNVAVKVCDLRIPRILRWSVSSKKIQYDRYNGYFAPTAVHLVPFDVSEVEKPKLIVLGVAEYIDSMVPPPSTMWPKMKKRKLIFNDDSSETSVLPVQLLRRSSRLARDASPATSNVGSTPCREKESCADLKAIVVDLRAKFAAFEAANNHNQILGMLSQIQSDLSNIITRQMANEVLGTNHTTASPSVEVCNVEKTPIGKKLPVPKVSLGEPVLLSENAVCGEELHKIGSTSKGNGRGKRGGVRKGGGVGKRGGVGKTEDSTAVVGKVKRASGSGLVLLSPQHRPKFYEPLEADYESKAVASEFQAWSLEAKKIKSEATVMLPSRLLRHGRACWFDAIWNPNKWLCSDHIDALINMLIYKARQFPDMFIGGWTCLEPFGWITLTEKKKYEQLYELLKPYVDGEYPHQGGLPWEEARVVYAIANIKEHWVAVEILFEEQKLVVYNSLSGTINWRSTPIELLNAARFLPWLCRRLGLWEKRKSLTELRTVWEVVEYANPPQQQNGSDCGIMALKYVECLISGLGVEELDPELCSIYRRSYCGQLFDFGKTMYRG